MVARVTFIGFAVLVATKDLGGGWEEKQKDDGRVVQELKIEAPMMTEEDQHGYNMPDQYKCDSCRAIMFHLNHNLVVKHPKSRRMKDWEYTEFFEETCKTAFEGYGVKLVNGKNKLSGPGIKDDAELAPGSGAIQMGGETWTKRLGELCRKYVFDKIGEEELYEMYRETGSIEESICYDELKACKKIKFGPDVPEVKTEKKEKKTTTKKPKKEEPASKKADTFAPTPEAKAKAKPQKSGQEEKVDVQSFLRSLASEHGLDSSEYLVARSRREWEKLTMALAGRVFNRMAENQGDGTCAA